MSAASGKSLATSAASAPFSSSALPLVETITGSTTIGMPRAHCSSPPATASTPASPPSMPVLTARIDRSEKTAAIWAEIMSGGTLWTAVTPFVFCAVTAVTAVAP